MRPTRIIAFLVLSLTGLGLITWVVAAKQPAFTTTLIGNPSSDDSLWQSVDKTTVAKPNAPANSASSAQTFRLNQSLLERLLSTAPMEHSAALKTSPAVISLPMPDGSYRRFRIEESPVMEPSLAAQLPEVKTYRGQGTDDPTATTRFDSTPQGFHAIILSGGDAIYVAPATPRQNSTYVSQLSGATSGGFKCGVTEADVAEAAARGVYKTSSKVSGPTPQVTNGTSLRSFRLAVAATGEWTTNYGGGTVGGAQSAIATMVNLVDAIYEKEVAVHFNLVNNTNIIFTNAASDPYVSPNAADSAALNANEATLDNNAFLGSANYDIGHLFGSGNGFFSGLAQVGVTCLNGSKAKGVSTMSGGSITTPQFINGIAHEIGHEFSATHTFNASSGSFCGAQRTAATAYEVGGGSTLMSYQVCLNENLQAVSDPYFYVSSLEQIVNYLTNNASCAATSGTGNTAPVVGSPGSFTIPANTPFALTAAGSDTNGPLTYSWEEYDLGAAGPPDTDDGSRPIFRGYKPTTNVTRYFPSLSYILNNANVPPSTYNGGCLDNSGNTILCLTGESLPATSRTLKFQVVARDNQATGGAINTAASTLTVVNSAGPFAVTAPNGGESWSGTHNVTWSVANTNVAPISVSNVKLSLSTDGGQTFPISLGLAPNTGSAAITFPNGILNSTCRVKVEALNNIFFDVSDANFTVTPADTCPAIASVSPKVAKPGDAVVISGVNFTGVTAVTFNSVPAASFAVNSDSQITATVPAGATGGPIALTKAGCNGVQTSNFTVCPAAPASLAIDDGSVETASTIGVNGAYYVNRLTPANYPATLSQVSVFWDPFQMFPPGTAINIVAGANTGGSTIDGTSFQVMSATAGAQPGFTTYTLSNPVTINSGDFVVGFQVPVAPANSYPVAVDTTSTPANRSYYSSNGTNFVAFGSGGNFMIRASQVYISCNAGAPVPLSVVSKKLHGGIPFDLNLPLSGTPAIESRLGGSTNDHQIVFTFPNAVTFTSASVTAGTGSISSTAGNGTSAIVVNLTGVANAQKMTLKLLGVSDGLTSGDIAVQIGFLLGDVNGDGTVNAADATVTRNLSGSSVDITNFRADANVDGVINAADALVVRSHSGDGLH